MITNTFDLNSIINQFKIIDANNNKFITKIGIIPNTVVIGVYLTQNGEIVIPATLTIEQTQELVIFLQGILHDQLTQS